MNNKIPQNLSFAIRVDGVGFSKFTEKNYEKPYDLFFLNVMKKITESIWERFSGEIFLTHTASDEISVFFSPTTILYSRRPEKFLSVIAGYVSACATQYFNLGVPVFFDAKLFVFESVVEVKSYLESRQANSVTNSYAGKVFWHLVNSGVSKKRATSFMYKRSTQSNMLYCGENGLEFDLYERDGFICFSEPYQKEATDFNTGEIIFVSRNRIVTKQPLYGYEVIDKILNV
jgi:tRNA(His) 5'-end guanylyltransferase